MRDWVFVTSSKEKHTEAERILGRRIIHQAIDLPELQSLRVEDVARKKAELAYERLSCAPVIVEDTGLYITCWNGLPGALIRWFEKTVGLEGICRMLDGFDDRSARAQTIVATCDGSTRLFSGEAFGRIADSPRGENGFGWDRIFIPTGESRTFA